MLLFVDQLEELYTLVEDESERVAFMEAVCTASDDPESPVRVVFTLRDDFLGRLATGDAARRALSRVTVLRSPGVEALREILIRPLEGVGFHYEDDALVDEMVDEVRGEPAALPLLQFAGQELWERRDRKRQLLTREAYRAVGGVAGALAHHARNLLLFETDGGEGPLGVLGDEGGEQLGILHARRGLVRGLLGARLLRLAI